MAEKNVLLTIAYDGSSFNGWQRQPDLRTVQGEVEKALEILTGETFSLNGTSRTDRGVHAYGQTASFRGDIKVPVANLKDALNNILGTGRKSMVPSDIFIKDAREVPLDFHARFNAVAKTYIYKIRIGKEPDIFKRNYFYEVRYPLDLKLMKEGALILMGTHDFKAFQSAGGEEKESTVRTVYTMDMRRIREGMAFHITGDGFLYNQVRIMMGTLVEVGLKKISPENLKEIRDGKDRAKAGHKAPSEGLYLAKVHFSML